MTSSDNHVTVVGAGPGGLLLAGELALAGVPCTVLERRAGPSAESRAVGLQARTLELLQLRNIADRFTAPGNPLGYFRITVGPARLDLSGLDTSFQQLTILPQSQTEQLLEEWAVSLGARVQRGTEVLGLEQDDGGVTLRVRHGGASSEQRADWVVGCDGSHSTVRASADIGFPGKTYPYSIVVGDVRLDSPPADGMLIEVGQAGLVVAIDFGNGWWRMGVVTLDPPRPSSERPDLAELRSGLTRIFGYDLGPRDPLWMTRFRFHKRHATTYRRSRVLLLGDAAHVHAPLGAQGLNMSMQDAMNLGWKLAAVITRRAPDALLDSYERERRPVSSRVLKATDMAIRVMMSQRPPVRAARRMVIPSVLRIPHGHQTMAGYVSGLAWSYPSPGSGGSAGLTGQRIPDVRLRAPGGVSRQFSEFFRAGQFVLLDQTGGHLAGAAKAWGDRVVFAVAEIEDRPYLAAYDAILSRPDGYCAWAGGRDDSGALLSALREWCGRPGRAAPAVRPAPAAPWPPGGTSARHAGGTEDADPGLSVPSAPATPG